VLLRAGVETAEVERVLSVSVERGTTLSSHLSEQRSKLSEALERELSRLDFPTIEMVRPLASQVALLPPGLCKRLAAVPVNRDPRSGRVDVAVLDPLDPHLAAELEFHLEAPVRLLLAREETLVAALRVMGDGTAPSGPPMPLVRKAPEATQEGAEPVLSLSRPKASDKKQTAPLPTEPSAEPPAQEATREPAEPVATVIDAISRAAMAEELAALLVRGMAPAPTVVLSVRSGVYSGRAASPWLSAEAVRKLKLDAGVPSVIETAARNGFYLGVLPLTPAHQALRDVFGGAEEREVYVVPVLMSHHPSLMLVSEIAPLGSSVEASRRADELVRAVGHALERIVLSKKRGA
jgi:hypothetical protein